VIAPFVTAPGNRNESPLLKEALPGVMRIAREVGVDLQDTIVGLDGAYDCRANRKAIFNRGMVPTSATGHVGNTLDRALECAPAGGHFEFVDLTPLVGLLENRSHGPTSFP
jgi:hypothetical protein